MVFHLLMGEEKQTNITKQNKQPKHACHLFFYALGMWGWLNPVRKFIYIPVKPRCNKWPKSVRNWGGKKKLLYRCYFTPVITGFLGPP